MVDPDKITVASALREARREVAHMVNNTKMDTEYDSMVGQREPPRGHLWRQPCC